MTEIDVTDMDAGQGLEPSELTFELAADRTDESNRSSSPAWTQAAETGGRDLTVVVLDVGGREVEATVGPPPGGADIAVRLGSRIRRVAVVRDATGAERIAVRTMMKATASYACSSAGETDAIHALHIVRRVLGPR